MTGTLTAIDTQSAAAALAWLVQAGVDTPVDATPRNWLAEPAAPMRPLAPRPVEARAPTPEATGAVTLAAAADSVEALAAAVAEFVHPLRRAGVAPQLATGTANRRILILTDMPDADASPAARLAERMLAAIGLDMTAARLVRLVPWPTPGGRSVTPREVAEFAPFISRLIALTTPRAVLAFGAAAASLSGESGGINSLRGRWLSIAGTDVPLLATCHPRALLTLPDQKRLAWADLQSFAARLDKSEP